MKTMTRQQLEARKARAVRFALDVLDKPGRADEIENESPEEYAERRHIQIRNPKGAKAVAIPTRRDLMDRIKELETDNEELQGQLDEISDIVSSADGDDNEGED